MITLEQAKAHLRITHNDEDTAIQAMIDAATVAAADYLNLPVVDIIDDMPTPVHAAILLQVGDLYENRERQADRQLYASTTYERLLSPYRVMVL